MSQLKGNLQADESPKLAIIDGRRMHLPPDARHTMQDKRGIWFYWTSQRRPGVADGDWSPDHKAPIVIRNADGHQRALITKPRDDWENTLMEVLKAK